MIEIDNQKITLEMKPLFLEIHPLLSGNTTQPQGHMRHSWFSFFRITSEGVDGSEPLYERVAAIADDWLKEHGLA
jgi:hypothetical protein